ncbi:MAG: PorT family protein [Muribaculaceae bacterium]|nr:PorT family protein [Muribaculaceae bacterium]MBR5118419.1 PorT family protein [Muribaculaceae bacterium]
MKKIAIALMCMLLAAGVATAQKRFTFGPKIGVDLTHFWGEGVDNDVVFGYQGGLFAEYRACDLIGIAPEVVFAAQGGKNSLGNTFHANYINIPLMLKIYVVPSFSIDLGPQFGFNIYSKYTPADGSPAVDMSGITKTFDFGAGLGATYNIASDVFVQARYTMSFTEFLRAHHEKHGNAQIAIGYRF